jgi:hypothetical protein
MTTLRNIDLKSFQKQRLEIFCFETPKPLFFIGKSVFGYIVVYFPGFGKEESLQGTVTVILLVFLLSRETTSLVSSSSALTSTASALLTLWLQ